MKHGMSRSPEYRAWQLMKNRCTNPRDKRWEHYGGRGIRVCERWATSFPTFFLDMGPRPSDKHSLDRIDVNLDYSPANCRWATQTQQQRNRSNNKLDEVLAGQIRWLCTDGGYSQSEVARAFNVRQCSVWMVLVGRQWAPEAT